MNTPLLSFRYLVLVAGLFLATVPSYAQSSPQPITYSSSMFQMLQPATILDYVIEDEIIMLTAPATSGTSASDFALVTSGQFSYEGETLVVQAKLVHTHPAKGNAQPLTLSYDLSSLRKFHGGRILLEIQGMGLITL